MVCRAKDGTLGDGMLFLGVGGCQPVQESGIRGH